MRKAWFYWKSRVGDPTWNMQYEVPRAYVSGSPTVAFLKDAPAGIDFELTQLYDTSQTAGEEMGRILVQHQAVA